MKPSSAYLGAVLLIALILIAFFAWRRRQRARRLESFYYTTPAVPRLREAAAELFAGLHLVADLGRRFEGQAAALADASPVAGERLSAAQMTRALELTASALSGAPPTYANYLAVYRGLTSTDAALLDAADAYRDAGRRAHQAVARAAAGGAAEDTGALAALGGTLLELGAQVRRVVADVHRLGVALDVE
jgi:hypothetical protein